MRYGNKFGAKKVKQDGYTFDSLAEAKRYRELCLLQKAGYISDLEVHPRFMLQTAFEDRDGQKHRAIHYEADFKYLEKGVETIEDVKGALTQEFKIKQKLFLFQYRQYVFRLVKV